MIKPNFELIKINITKAKRSTANETPRQSDRLNKRVFLCCKFKNETQIFLSTFTKQKQWKTDEQTKTAAEEFNSNEL